MAARTIPPLDKPNRRTIEALFKSLIVMDRQAPIWEEYNRLRKEEDALENKLLDSPKLKRLKKQREAAFSKAYHKNRIARDKALELQRYYFANGITKELLARLNQLLKTL